MSEPNGTTNRLDEVARLATALSDRVLNAQFLGHEIPAEQVDALLKAATLLQDLGEPWPTMLTQALLEIADRAQEASSGDEARTAGETDLPPPETEPTVEGGLKGFLARARRRKR